MKKISRAEAQRQGLKRYFTGKPCKRGHGCERYVVDCQCYLCALEKCRRSYGANKTRQRKRALAYRNLNVQACRDRALAWAKTYPQKNRARVAKRTAAKLLRTPPWADLDAIRAFYEACPEGLVVDHYYPLQGERISGLHVLENLRHIPSKENSAKRNKMPEDFYK